MAKIRIKQEKATPLGGVFSVMQRFDPYAAKPTRLLYVLLFLN